MIKKVILWIAVIFMSCQIFSFSAKTAEESSNLSSKFAQKAVELIEKVVKIEEREEMFDAFHLIIRKSAHFFEFAVLSVLVFFLCKSYEMSYGCSILISIGYCLLFASADEFHQLFVDGRSGNLLDVFIDFAGSAGGVGISYLCTKQIDKK